MTAVRTQFEDLFRNVEITVSEDLAASFMYEGFNADQIMQHLMGMKMKNNVGDAAFVRDIVDIITLGAIMGNYNSNNKTKISEDGRRSADKLMVKYALQEGGAQGNRKIVNVPRVMATFPDITVTVISKVPFERNYGNQFLCIDLPKFMKTSVFPAIIPKRLNVSVKKVLLIASTCYSAEQTMALRNSDDAVAAFGAQKRFTQLSHDSAFPKQSVREAILQTFEFDFVAIMRVVNKVTVMAGLEPVAVTAEDFTGAGLTLKATA